MPFVPAPNIVMCEARATMDGQQVENRFMCHSPTAVNAAKVEDVAIAVWNWWELHYATVLTNQVTLREVVATDLTTEEGVQFTYAPDATTTGTFAGVPLPNEVSLCISLRTGNRGRSARGRYFQLQVPEDARLGVNTITPAYAALAVEVGQQLINALDTVAPLTIVSFINDGAPRPGGPVYFHVTSATLVDNFLDSMRSRKPGVGS